MIKLILCLLFLAFIIWAVFKAAVFFWRSVFTFGKAAISGELKEQISKMGDSEKEEMGSSFSRGIVQILKHAFLFFR